MIGTPRNIVEAGLEGAVACASPFALFGIAKILFAGATKAAIVATATALGVDEAEQQAKLQVWPKPRLVGPNPLIKVVASETRLSILM
jgi:hypothetical protein